MVLSIRWGVSLPALLGERLTRPSLSASLCVFLYGENEEVV